MKIRERFTFPIVTVSIILLAVFIISGFLSAATNVAGLISKKVTSPPTIDGNASDAAWKNVPELKVQAHDGPEIRIKSVYTSDSLYMLISWDDETESIKKNTWTYDGAEWDRLKEQRIYEGKPTKSDEDRLSIHWPINDSINGFAENGCLVLCHDSGSYAKQESRMFTNSPKEFADQWHWKAARTNPIGYLDDKWLDNKVLTRAQEPDLYSRREAAHHGDDKGEGGLNYSDNKNADGKPKFMPKAIGQNNYFLAKEDAVLIDYLKATFKKGDTLPGYVLARPKGSRGEVDAKGVWKDGHWTLEIGRKLITADKEHDVQFDNLTKAYHFHLAIFDNSGSSIHTRPIEPNSLFFK